MCAPFIGRLAVGPQANRKTLQYIEFQPRKFLNEPHTYFLLSGLTS